MINFYRHAGCLSEQLCLATTVHGDEPPRGFLDAVADCDQTMISQNRSFVLSESLCDSLALRRFIHDAGEIREKSVVLIKRAGVLRDGIEQPPERGPGFSVHRMRMRRCNHVRTRRMYLRMDGKRRSINWIISFQDFAAVIYQN